MEREDRAPDLPDRVVELRHGTRQTLINSVIVDRRGNALQAKTSRKQPLNDMIMQIARNAVAILEDAQRPEPATAGQPTSIGGGA